MLPAGSTVPSTWMASARPTHPGRQTTRSRRLRVEVVVLGGWLSNSSPSLVRALEAYRRLSLTGVVRPIPRQVAKRTRRLTDSERTHLVERYLAGATVYDLAREFSVARSTAAKHLKAAGVTMRCGPLSADEIARAIELYVEGLSLVAVGKELGRDHAAIWRALKSAGIERRDTHGRERASS